MADEVYRLGASQNVAFAAAGGASAATTVLGPQTYYVLISVVGLNAAGSGIRIAIGDGTPTASATSTLVPVNYPMTFVCTPGQKVAVISNDTTAGSVSVTELS